MVCAVVSARPAPLLADSEASALLSWLLSRITGVKATRAWVEYDTPPPAWVECDAPLPNSTITATATTATTAMPTAAPIRSGRLPPVAADLWRGAVDEGGGNPPLAAGGSELAGSVWLSTGAPAPPGAAILIRATVGSTSGGATATAPSAVLPFLVAATCSAPVAFSVTVPHWGQNFAPCNAVPHSVQNTCSALITALLVSLPSRQPNVPSG